MFDILIRPRTNIKSRQWWNSKIICLMKHLPKHIKGRSLSLLKKSSFTLLITTDKEIQDLNKRFRRTNRPTDVLSFYLNKKEQLCRKYLGDIVISMQYAKKQASKKKILLEDELQTLLIHGYLHLLGYDHKLQNQAQIMFSLQNKLLLAMKFY